MLTVNTIIENTLQSSTYTADIDSAVCVCRVTAAGQILEHTSDSRRGMRHRCFPSSSSGASSWFLPPS